MIMLMIVTEYQKLITRTISVSQKGFDELFQASMTAKQIVPKISTKNSSKKWKVKKLKSKNGSKKTAVADIAIAGIDAIKW